MFCNDINSIKVSYGITVYCTKCSNIVPPSVNQCFSNEVYGHSRAIKGKSWDPHSHSDTLSFNICSARGPVAYLLHLRDTFLNLFSHWWAHIASLAPADYLSTHKMPKMPHCYKTRNDTEWGKFYSFLFVSGMIINLGLRIC